MSCTASHLLATARPELGTEEKPAKSNKVPYTKWYGMVAAWCAIFVSWVAWKAGATDIIPRHAYTPSGAAWFQKRDQWGKAPRVGAIVYYEFPGMDRISHVGIVETVHGDGSWTAIEGNTDEAGGRTGGKVMRKRRHSVGSRGGFGYPEYDPEPRPKPKRYVGKPTVKGWQTLLRFAPSRRDGDWGNDTEQRSRWLRGAALYKDGTLGGSKTSTIKLVQRVIGTPDDGDWGPASRGAMDVWTKSAQSFLGVVVDGDWGKKTDAAYQAFRSAHYMKF